MITDIDGQIRCVYCQGEKCPKCPIGRCLIPSEDVPEWVHWMDESPDHFVFTHDYMSTPPHVTVTDTTPNGFPLDSTRRPVKTGDHVWLTSGFGLPKSMYGGPPSGTLIFAQAKVAAVLITLNVPPLNLTKYTVRYIDTRRVEYP